MTRTSFYNIFSLFFPHPDSVDCKEEKDLRLSDLDDMDEDDSDKLDNDCEKVAVGDEELQRAMAASGGSQKKDCGSDLQLNLTNNFHSFPCAIKSVTSLPPLPSDFLDPVASKGPSSIGLTGTVTLSHFETPDKPRIWSLARTAASGVILSPQHHGSELRTGNLSGDCLQSNRLIGAPAGHCGGLRGLHDSGSTESPFSEGSPLHSKVYGSYSHKELQLHCSTYPTLPDTCPYSTIEGTSPSLWNLEHTSCVFTSFLYKNAEFTIQHKIFPEMLSALHLSQVCQFLWHALIWVHRILWGQSRDTVYWPQRSLRDHAGWQGHCIQTGDEEVRQMRVCTELNQRKPAPNRNSDNIY